MAKAGYERFAACDTASDDVCLIAFTSGTTGEPKGTMHFHRDMLATCDSYGRHVLRAEASDRFIGSPPIAFTFGLGGLVLFPLRVGAATILLEKAAPDDLLAGHREISRDDLVHRADRLSRDAGEARRARHLLAAQMRVRRRGAAEGDLRRLAGRHRHQDPRRHRRDRDAAHLHRLARATSIRPGATGKPVPGYEARVIDERRQRGRARHVGRLAVRGPTGCRYLADKRQRQYVQNGWNVTGDTYLMDADGYFWYQARSDDMIIRRATTSPVPRSKRRC